VRVRQQNSGTLDRPTAGMGRKQMQDVLVVLLIGLVLLVSLLSVSGPVWPWLRARRARASVALSTLLDLQLRKIPPGIIVDAYLVLQASEDPPSITDLASMYQERRGEVRDSGDLVRLFRG